MTAQTTLTSGSTRTSRRPPRCGPRTWACRCPRWFVNGAPVVIDDDSLISSAATRQARAQAMADDRTGDYVVLAGADDVAGYDPSDA
ncbi:MAG: hypothetical protein FWE61_11605 [Micrococcales bacterium]|nr:hypothetical protein [Micrococcales bacterium]